MIVEKMRNTGNFGHFLQGSPFSAKSKFRRGKVTKIRFSWLDILRIEKKFSRRTTNC
jgi:hypothetical protein